MSRKGCRRLAVGGWLVLLMLCVNPVSAYIGFKTGYEYKYHYNSTVTMHSVGDFLLQATIVVERIASHQDSIELALDIHDYAMRQVTNPEWKDAGPDLTKWFSFDITWRGEIRTIYFSGNEDSHTLGLKKGFANLFSGKLLQRDEVDLYLPEDELTHNYHTTEIGPEGIHNAYYTVVQEGGRKKIKKRRINYQHDILNLDTSSEKTIHFDDDLGTVHRIDVDEDVTSLHTAKPGFDPFYAARKVGSVNTFDEQGIPNLRTSTKGSLYFIGRSKKLKRRERPEDLLSATINDTHKQTGSIPYKKMSNISLVYEYISSNLTYIKQFTQKESVDRIKYLQNIVNTLKSVSDGHLTDIAKTYFSPTKESDKKLQFVSEDQGWMVDAFSVLNREASDHVLLDSVLKDPSQEQLARRWLVHLASRDDVPSKAVTMFLIGICDGIAKEFLANVSDKTYHNILLTLGGLAHIYKTHGEEDTVASILSCLHQKLGIHDPWMYRQKRDTLTRREQVKNDQLKVVLLEALGNGRQESSFEYIVSNVNSTNSPWIKRAGLHALRHYHTNTALNTIMDAALNDNNEEVRYEALLRYQGHPLGSSKLPFDSDNLGNRTDVSDTSYDLEESPHHLSKRSIFKKEFRFRLKAPSVDWQMLLGSTNIGASVGLIMSNFLDLRMSLLSGWMNLEVHDEAYARVHLGILGINYDFILASVCYKVGVSYDVNTILEYDPVRKARELLQIAKDFKSVFDDIVSGINLVKDIIVSGPSLKTLVNDFIAAVRGLPDQVNNLRQTAVDAMDRFGKYAFAEISEFMQPVKKVILYVTNLFSDIKSDVLDFYNTIVEVVDIRLPRAAERFFTAVKGIIDTLGQIFKDPKTTIARIGKGVVSIAFSIKEFKQMKTTVMDSLFVVNGKTPYWMDIQSIFEEVTDMVTDAFEALSVQGQEWVEEIKDPNNDVIFELTGGRMTAAQIRKLIISECESILQDLMKPFNNLLNVGKYFLNAYDAVFNLIKTMKDAYIKFKQGFQRARSVMEGVFGPQCPKDFPNKIRLADSVCEGSGFYPSKLQNQREEYKWPGVDVVVEEGDEIVAPFSGIAVINGNDLVIEDVDELPDGTDVILSNVIPVEDIFRKADPLYQEKKVNAGDVVGHAAQSPCFGTSSIHFAVRREGDVIDPSRFLPPRNPEWPALRIFCNDRKLVFRGLTIDADELGEEEREDSSEYISDSGAHIPESVRSDYNPSSDAGSESKFISSVTGSRDNSGQFSKPTSLFDALLERTQAFIDRFSVKRLKLGELLDFMNRFKMDESKTKLFAVFGSVKAFIENEPCRVPDQMTNDELQCQLFKRGKASDGNRQGMIKSLTTNTHDCALLGLSLPTFKSNENLYCHYEDSCLGIECCVTLKLLDLLQISLKAYAKYNPEDSTLYLAFGKWKKSFLFDFQFEEIENTIGTGIVFDVLDLELLIHYKVIKTEKAISVSVGIELFPGEHLWTIVENAIFRLPIFNADGSISFPEVDWQQYFNQEVMKNRFLDAGRNVVAETKKVLFKEFLEVLGISEELLNNTAACPIPEKMTDAEINRKLAQNGLSTDGSREERIQRYRELERTCTVLNQTFVFSNNIDDDLRKYLYYNVSTDCMKVDVCVELPIPGLNITKAFAAYLHLDPCKFVLKAGFETWGTTIYLLGYDWGKEERLELTEEIYFTFTIDKKEEFFEFSASIKIGFIDKVIFARERIPLCNGDFRLPGTGELSSLADLLQGQMPKDAFMYFLEALELDKLFGGVCEVPTLPTDCDIDVADFIPEVLSGIASCALTDGCHGINCCINFNYSIPLSDETMTATIPFKFSFDPCKYEVELEFASYYLRVKLVDYDWGRKKTVLIGKSDDIITVNFDIRKHDIDVFTVNLEVKICFDIANEKYCIPPEGLYLLENKQLGACISFDDLYPDFQLDFSIRDWLNETEFRIGEAGLDYILKRTKLTEIVDNTCDRSREPFSPSVDGWNIGCQKTLAKLPSLPDFVSCHVSRDCKTIDCCLDISLIELSVLVSIEFDFCSNKIVSQIEKSKEAFEDALSEYEWGSTVRKSISNVLFFEYRLDKTAMKYIVDLHFAACFEKNGDCLVNTTLMDRTELPHSFCPGTECVTSIREKGFYCMTDADCQGLICDVTSIMGENDTQINTDVRLKFRLEYCKDRIILGIGDTKWIQSLSAVIRGKIYSDGSDGRLSFVLNENAASFNASMNISLCDSSGDDAVCGNALIFKDFKFLKNSCSNPQSRRKRSSEGESNPTAAIKELLQSGAGNEELANAIRTLQENEINMRRTVLETVDLDDSDSNSSFKSVVKSLGQKNPMNLVFTSSLQSNTDDTITGATEIANFLKTAQDTSENVFEIGKGLTNKGAEMLAKKLASMTVGDLIAMLELCSSDASQVSQLIMDLIDLVQTLYCLSEMPASYRPTRLYIVNVLTVSNTGVIQVSNVIEQIASGELRNTFASFDLAIRGDFSFPPVYETLFMGPPILFMVGPVPIFFHYGANCVYGLNIKLGMKVLNMAAEVTLVPYGGVTVWGAMSVGFVLYARLELVGHIMQVSLPSYAEIGFSKFPLDVSLKMDMELVPLKLELNGLCTLEIDLGWFGTIRKVLFKASIWRYTTPKISKRLIDLSTKAEDDSPPQFNDPFQDTDESTGWSGHCNIQQLPGRDYTTPGFQIMVAASDSSSRVRYFLNIGTVPGGSDVVQERELGGETSKIYENLSPTGVPLYFTVFAQNSAGMRSAVSCSIPSYDVTLPSGRLTADFATTSNPALLKASVVTHDETALKYIAMAVGYGKHSYGDQISNWQAVSVEERSSDVNTGDDPFNLRTTEHFTGMKDGRLIADSFRTIHNVHTVGFCARHCLDYDEHSCLSFNYDFGPDGTCELLKAIEGHSHSIANNGLFSHYERLGIGHAVELVVEDLLLQHNFLYFFNLDLINELEYRNIISSKGVLCDLTPPEPGVIKAAAEDYNETLLCESIIPDDRSDLDRFCVGVNPSIKNHRVIVDGPGSQTVFNGAEAMTDLLYTRVRNYISRALSQLAFGKQVPNILEYPCAPNGNQTCRVNFHGFHDYETQIRAYTWAVGKSICEELIHPHHDPHRHLLSESHWDNRGQIFPIPLPEGILADGAYYITVRALNKVEHGGPLSLTVCHSIPLIVDTSPPIFYEIFGIRYDERSKYIYAEFNFSDPHSGMSVFDFCLGETTSDCGMMPWHRFNYTGNVEHRFSITDGIPAWIRVQGFNKVKLSTVGIANQAIIVDSTPPVQGVVNDGAEYKTDAKFTKFEDLICANWLDFFDPESGIAEYLIGVGTEPGKSDVVPLVTVDGRQHEACLTVDVGNELIHGHTYYVTLTAFNGAIVQRNTTAISNGVFVDLTKPERGDVIDGTLEEFQDMSYTASMSTVGLQWNGFSDPQSDIASYSVKVESFRNGEEEVLQDWTDVNTTLTSMSWQNFHLQHGSVVKSILRATNGAGNDIESTTNGFVVDHTPPTLLFLGDGPEVGKDIQFQVNSTSLASNFLFEDQESDVAGVRFQIYGRSNGQKNQIFPTDDGEWYETDVSDTDPVFIRSGLTLQTGTVYSMRVGAINKAGIIGVHETTGVILDDTIPEIVWVKIGVQSGYQEDLHDGYVYQSDHHRIMVSWLALDAESGIEFVKIGIGNMPGSTEVMQWTQYIGTKSDVIIENLDLQNTDTDPSVMAPVYYINIQAFNGAGQSSDITISSPLAIVPEDAAGILNDGSDSGDIDYQSDLTTLGINFDGFQSSLHGITSFELAIGSVPGGEDVQPFMEIIVQTDEVETDNQDVMVGGEAQTLIDLQHGLKYFQTVRAITNAGNVLQSVSDGIVVDRTPPNVTFDRILDTVMSAAESHSAVYSSSVSYLSAAWHITDDEYHLDGHIDNVVNSWYAVGTTETAAYTWSPTQAPLSTTNVASLPYRDINVIGDGVPNILTVAGVNAAGLVSISAAPEVIIDNTPPGEGKVTCNEFTAKGQFECSWSGFIDSESPIEHYIFSVVPSEGQSVLMETILSPDASQHTVSFTELEHGNELIVKVTAFNKVFLETVAFSSPIVVDKTPPTGGKVSELSQETVVSITDDGTTPEDCLPYQGCIPDAVCQESLTSIAVAWEHFHDPESRILRYEMAIGTTPGGIQVKDFVPVTVDVHQKSLMYEMHGLNLQGLTQVFVKIKGINGAGLEAVVVSNGVYLSYISQGVQPPSPVGIWDDHPDSVGDIDYQIDTNIIYAGWDVSGDPCPVIKLEWAVARIDGKELQAFTETKNFTGGFNDRVEMSEMETYYSLLRVTNALGFSYVIQSNGVTVHGNALSAGQVFDGYIPGYDLEILPSRAEVSCNWYGFGAANEISVSDVLTGNSGVLKEQSETPQHVVSYYEVALGTDRRFPKTRDNVMPFTNVGTETSVTFKDLELTPGNSIYYCTVRAFSASYSSAEMTSNGFYVDFNGGVSSGQITVPEYNPSDISLDIQWDEYSSEVEMMIYFVAVSTNVLAQNTDCKHYVDGGRATTETKMQYFDVFPVTDVGMSTFISLKNLTLTQGEMYFVWIMGVDYAGECNMTFVNTTVDVTAPVPGDMTAGPYYNMRIAYTSKSSLIHVKWKDYADQQSGIKSYTLSTYVGESCDENTVFKQFGSDIILSSSSSEYDISELDLQALIPYKILLTIENGAGLTITKMSPPILFDGSVPTTGDVKEGVIYTDDVVWWGSSTEVKGTLLHVQSPDVSTCPVQHIDFNEDTGWTRVMLDNIYDVFGNSRNLKYSPEYVKPDQSTGTLRIKFTRDTKYSYFLTGAYSILAHFENEGSYEISLQSSGQQTITEILFLDASPETLHAFVHTAEEDWTLSNLCQCCHADPRTQNCQDQCNCTTVTDEPEIQEDGETQLPQRGCGIQIYAGNEPYVVQWCRDYNSTNTRKTRTQLQFEPSRDYHKYRIEFKRQREDLQKTLNMGLYIDGALVSSLYAIPQLSTSCNFILHILNTDSHIPEFDDVFDVDQSWTTHAHFRDLVFPPSSGSLCRYGKPFIAGDIPIVSYEASIGTSPGQRDIKDYVKVWSPCIPCSDKCSRYDCDAECEKDSIRLMTFVLSDLNLQSVTSSEHSNDSRLLTYYLNVKAVLGSGAFAQASSNGFYIDVSPPYFDLDALLYIDVSQGENTPVKHQGSNSTIKAIWMCLDDETEMQEYQWAIGTFVGGKDVQEFTSTGLNNYGINDGLTGVLEHNMTYYVTIQCTNEAGLSSVWKDTGGVVVLLEAPDPDTMQAEMAGTDDFDEPVVPADAKEMKDPTSIGVIFTVPDDPTITRYDLCIASTLAEIDDIVPCTWISVNQSGEVLIKDGYVTFDGNPLYSLNDMRPVGNTEPVSANPGTFHMEPGRNLFIRMRLCNEAMHCGIKLLGTTVVVGSKSEMKTSDGSNPLSVTVDGGVSRRKREAEEITIHMPQNLTAGQTVIVTPLAEEDLSVKYASDASMSFVSYVTSTNDTINETDRLLAGRLLSIDKTFSMATVGQLALPGPMSIIFPQTEFNSTDGDVTNVLIHWDPSTSQWSLTSYTCTSENDNETSDSSTTETKVCNTRAGDQESQYFYQETQFAIATASTAYVNLPPVLVTKDVATMKEDEGIMVVQLMATDPEGDSITYTLVSSTTNELGYLNLSKEGLLTFKPCLHCHGSFSFDFQIHDTPLVPEIPGSTVEETLSIEVESINDAPIVFLVDDNSDSLLHSDKTEVVKVYLENRNAEGIPSTFSAVFGAFDVDRVDFMEIESLVTSNGTVEVNILEDSYADRLICNATLCLGSVPDINPGEMTWVLAELKYTQTTSFTGVDTVKMVVKDNKGSYSDVITVQFVVMETPCLHMGTCIEIGMAVTCNDEMRINNYYANYECVCIPQWQGISCEIDVDECEGSPCHALYNCVNVPGSYRCELAVYYPILISVGCLVPIIGVIVLIINREKIKKKWQQRKGTRVEPIAINHHPEWKDAEHPVDTSIFSTVPALCINNRFNAPEHTALPVKLLYRTQTGTSLEPAPLPVERTATTLSMSGIDTVFPSLESAPRPEERMARTPTLSRIETSLPDLQVPLPTHQSGDFVETNRPISAISRGETDVETPSFLSTMKVDRSFKLTKGGPQIAGTRFPVSYMGVESDEEDVDVLEQ